MPSSETENKNGTVNLNLQLAESLIDENRNKIYSEPFQKSCTFTPVLPIKQKIKHFFQQKIWIFPLISAFIIPFFCITM